MSHGKHRRKPWWARIAARREAARIQAARAVAEARLARVMRAMHAGQI